METASQISGIRLWITNEFMHSGLRDGGSQVLDQLFGMLKGKKPLFWGHTLQCHGAISSHNLFPCTWKLPYLRCYYVLDIINIGIALQGFASIANGCDDVWLGYDHSCRGPSPRVVQSGCPFWMLFRACILAMPAEDEKSRIYLKMFKWFMMQVTTRIGKSINQPGPAQYDCAGFGLYVYTWTIPGPDF